VTPCGGGVTEQDVVDMNRRLGGDVSHVLQCFFAQHIGIAFTGFEKRDKLRGDRLFDGLVAVSSPQSDAEHFKCNA
jgi:hypothetical protein